MEEFQAVT